jgi:hypothetical protein
VESPISCWFSERPCRASVSLLRDAPENDDNGSDFVTDLTASQFRALGLQQGSARRAKRAGVQNEIEGVVTTQKLYVVAPLYKKQ